MVAISEKCPISPHFSVIARPLAGNLFGFGTVFVLVLLRTREKQDLCSHTRVADCMCESLLLRGCEYYEYELDQKNWLGSCRFRCVRCRCK